MVKLVRSTNIKYYGYFLSYKMYDTLRFYEKKYLRLLIFKLLQRKAF